MPHRRRRCADRRRPSGDGRSGAVPIGSGSEPVPIRSGIAIDDAGCEGIAIDDAGCEGIPIGDAGCEGIAIDDLSGETVGIGDPESAARRHCSGRQIFWTVRDESAVDPQHDRTAGREYHWRTISDRDLLRKALITEDALRIWRKKYPADPWLAPTFFHLEQLYQAVQTQEGRKHATAILKDIVLNYPASKEGHLSRSRIAAGFPVLVPESPLIATPAPPSRSPEVPSPEAPSGSASGASAVPATAAPSLPSATAAASTPGVTPSSSRTPQPVGSPRS